MRHGAHIVFMFQLPFSLLLAPQLTLFDSKTQPLFYFGNDPNRQLKSIFISGVSVFLP
jgi:hypothetical protein